MPIVESIKLINEEYWGKNGTKRQKIKMRNFFKNCLRYQGLNQIIIYTDCNRVKGSLD